MTKYYLACAKVTSLVISLRLTVYALKDVSLRAWTTSHYAILPIQNNSNKLSVLWGASALEDACTGAQTLIYGAALLDTLKFKVRVGASTLADAATWYVVDGVSRSRRI